MSESGDLFVADMERHVVKKWKKDENKGIIVAGGHGNENSSTQLSYPQGLFVSKTGNVYVADQGNHRIMRWPPESQNGHIIVVEISVEKNHISCVVQ